MASADATAKALSAVESKPGNPCSVDKKKCPQKVVILITVKRKYNYHDKGTPGDFDARLKGAAAAKITGFTTEQPPGKRDLGHGNKEYPIPAGTYKGKIKTGSGKNGNVPGHRHEAVEVLDVPNFKDILIHTGNYPSDSEGCIILGGENANGDQDISQSKTKVQELMDWIDEVKAEYGEENVSIEVVVQGAPADAKPPALPKPAKK